jgi:hypothetical protein
MRALICSSLHTLICFWAAAAGWEVPKSGAHTGSGLKWGLEVDNAEGGGCSNVWAQLPQLSVCKVDDLLCCVAGLSFLCS